MGLFIRLRQQPKQPRLVSSDQGYTITSAERRCVVRHIITNSHNRRHILPLQ
jgi:hypothetical protein